MRILIAGATGAVGSRLVPLVVAAGHQVTGLTRTASKATEIERAGARPAVADALDGQRVRQVVLDAEPEVVIHEMTALHDSSDLIHFDRTFSLTNRLRTEGLDNLLSAARESGVRRVIAQSFCGWPYARTGGPIKTEEGPLDPDPPRELHRTLNAIRHLENAVAGGVVFRGRRAAVWRFLRARLRHVGWANDRSSSASARATDWRRGRLVVVSPSR